VWCGFDSNHDLPGGSNQTLGIWRKTMSKIMEGKEKCDFNQSKDVLVYSYCGSSGDVATSYCYGAGKGYFKTSYAPACKVHGGAPREGSKQPDPVGGKFADITQDPVPEYDAWRNGATPEAEEATE
ncbi:MAG: hypothetical protein IKU10_07520, partial [Clostridia bacterium]|nr:hypothetical protein [Clostridia bacterium]